MGGLGEEASMGAAEIEVEEARWPLVVVRWPDGPITDEAIERYLRVAIGHMKRGRHFVLHLTVRVAGLDARQRRTFAEHIELHRSTLKAKVGGAAIVVDSAIARGVITAVNWIAPPPFPQRVFATEGEAEAYLAQLIAAEQTRRAG